MFLKCATLLLFWCYFNVTFTQDVSRLPSLCVVCKCTQQQGNKYDIECTDENVPLELSRNDSWPSSVRSFSLTHASLTQLPKLPSESTNLKFLNSLSLSHNALEDIPENAFEHLNLKELNLAYNGLKELNSASLYGNDELEMLNLQHNNFETIDWEVLNALQNLQFLYLQDNYIKTLEGKTELNLLKVLNMSGNQLEEIPKDTCSGLQSLQTLLLADNKLPGVPSCILNLQELRELVLDGNPIHQIAGSAFYTLTKLEFLSLSHLPELNEIDGSALKGLVALNNLQISHNPKLTSVHRSLLLGEDAAQHHWSYTHVDLSYNSLKSIPKDLAPWDIIISLDLQGNPWDCTCEAQWMLDTLVPALYNRNSSQLVEVRCASPPKFAGRRLVHWLNKQSLRGIWCEEDSAPAQLQTQVTLIQSGSSHGMLIALSVVAGVVLILIGVGVVLQRRATAQRKELATSMGRCRNPRNGSVRLTNPKLGI